MFLYYNELVFSELLHCYLIISQLCYMLLTFKSFKFKSDSGLNLSILEPTASIVNKDVMINNMIANCNDD